MSGIDICLLMQRDGIKMLLLLFSHHCPRLSRGKPVRHDNFVLESKISMHEKIPCMKKFHA